MSKRAMKKVPASGGAKDAAGNGANGAKIPIFANGGNICVSEGGEALPVFCYWADTIPCSACRDQLYRGGWVESPYLHGSGGRDSIFGGCADEAPVMPSRRRRN